VKALKNMYTAISIQTANVHCHAPATLTPRKESLIPTYLTEGLLGGSESRLEVVITKTNKSYFKLMFPQFGTTDRISSLCGIESSSIQIQNKDYSLNANYKSVESNIL
jgi:hypothetical protein